MVYELYRRFAFLRAKHRGKIIYGTHYLTITVLSGCYDISCSKKIIQIWKHSSGRIDQKVCIDIAFIACEEWITTKGCQLFIMLVMLISASLVGVNFGTFPRSGSSQGPIGCIVVGGPYICWIAGTWPGGLCLGMFGAADGDIFGWLTEGMWSIDGSGKLMSGGGTGCRFGGFIPFRGGSAMFRTERVGT